MQPNRVYDWISEKGATIDLLINNAGVGSFGPFHQTDIDAEIGMLQLNMFGAYALTRLFVADMIRRDQGTIVCIASQAAYTASPYLAAYAASKSFLLSYCRAAHFEMKDQGIGVRVLAVCPPPMRTGFAVRARMKDHPIFRSWVTTDVHKVARACVWAIDRGKQGYIPILACSFYHAFP